MSLLEGIKKYSQLFGPSGEEDEPIRAFVQDLRAEGLEPHTDPLGNVIAKLSEAHEGYPTLMLSAHLDEVGFVVRKVEEDGYLRLHRVGGVNDRVVAGQRLVFRGEGGEVEGVVGVKAKHASTAEELATVITVDDAYVDVFVSSAEEAQRRGITVGTLGAFRGVFGQHADFISGKALDDRVGVAMLLEVARRMRGTQPKVGVVLVATVQEEFSVRGGVTAARAVGADLAVCLDVAIATDTPDLQALGSVHLGRGPVISRFSRANLNGIIPNPKLRRFVSETADRLALPIQYGVLQGGLTDGSFMQYEGKGIPTLDLSFPTRYTHTPVETCHLEDIEGGVHLVLGMLEHMPEGFDLGRE